MLIKFSANQPFYCHLEEIFSISRVSHLDHFVIIWKDNNRRSVEIFNTEKEIDKILFNKNLREEINNLQKSVERTQVALDKLEQKGIDL